MFGEQESDPQWGARLWEEHNEQIVAFAEMLLRAHQYAGDCHDAAKDITQQTFTTAWARQDVVKASVDMRVWLRNTARNMIRNLVGSAAHRWESAHEGEHFDLCPDQWTVGPSAAAEIVVDRLVFEEAMTELSGPERELLTITYWDDLSTRQIADLYGITDAAVRTRQCRARGSLVTILEKQGVIDLKRKPDATDGDNDD